MIASILEPMFIHQAWGLGDSTTTAVVFIVFSVVMLSPFAMLYIHQLWRAARAPGDW